MQGRSVINILSIGFTLVLTATYALAEKPVEDITETVYDRVCVVEAAHLYTDGELANPLSPRMLEYWEFVSFIEGDPNGKAEMIKTGFGDKWWVSTEEVRPVYRVKEQAELIVPKLAIPDDSGAAIEHMGILDYLEPGERVALSVQPISTIDGYLMVGTEDWKHGFVLEDKIEPYVE